MDFLTKLPRHNLEHHSLYIFEKYNSFILHSLFYFAYFCRSRTAKKKGSKENNETGQNYVFLEIYCEGNFKLCRDSFVRKFVHLYDQSDDWEVEGKGEGCRGKCRPSKGRSTVKVSGGSGNRAISKLVGRWVGRSVSLSLGLSIGLTIGHTTGRSVGRAIGGTVFRSDGRSVSMSVCYSKGPLHGN